VQSADAWKRDNFACRRRLFASVAAHNEGQLEVLDDLDQRSRVDAA
jgi:hypothetical protein